MGFHIKNWTQDGVEMFKNKLLIIESINHHSEEWKSSQIPLAIE